MLNGKQRQQMRGAMPGVKDPSTRPSTGLKPKQARTRQSRHDSNPDPDPHLFPTQTWRPSLHQRNVRQIITLHSSAWGRQLSASQPHPLTIRPFPPAVLQVVAMCRVRGNWDGRWFCIRIRIWICWWSPPHSSKPTSRGFRGAINAFEIQQKSILPALQNCREKKIVAKLRIV